MLTFLLVHSTTKLTDTVHVPITTSQCVTGRQRNLHLSLINLKLQTSETILTMFSYAST